MTSLQNMNISENKILRDLCTLGVGGTVKYFAAPDSVSDLVKILLAAKNEKLPVYVLGGGSNIIFPDSEIIDGLVIATGNLSAINWDKNFIDVQAGYKLPLLVKNFREKNLGGLEFAAGIPGTLGGAIYGNAGTSGHGICELVESVLTLDSSGNLKNFSAENFSFEYRKCSLADDKIIIISAKIRLNALSWNEGEYQKVLSSRKNQPLNFRSAGCTFKNPAGLSAGKLLDECGCKNLSVGGAVVSDRHANFILNINNASYSDIINLIEICRRKVLNLTGINLEQEIKIAAPCFVRQ